MSLSTKSGGRWVALWTWHTGTLPINLLPFQLGASLADGPKQSSGIPPSSLHPAPPCRVPMPCLPGSACLCSIISLLSSLTRGPIKAALPHYCSQVPLSLSKAPGWKAAGQSSRAFPARLKGLLFVCPILHASPALNASLWASAHLSSLRCSLASAGSCPPCSPVTVMVP